jgi:sulfite dehydrogenase (quinone) subunit SoeC
MHPAYSVIFFTTASGAGYGLLALLAIFGAAGLLPATTAFGLVSIGLAVVLVTAGLLSSTFHLGRPERAWRALSQWRSSWLAREGVAALATFAPIAIFAIGWIFLNDTGGLFAWMGVIAALMTLVTVSCTAMIYASLKTIRQWNNALTLPVYLALALMTGAILLVSVTAAFSVFRPAFAWLALALLALGFALKLAWWRHIDSAPARSTLGSATGLSSFGEVRLLEMPHTEENFLMREMGFQIARKHAQKLRIIATLCLFVAPMVLMAIILLLGPAAALPCAALATLGAGVGVVTERWLFFAEATHVSMLYYGRAA